MKGQIFISYRREDSAYATGRLYDRLNQHFGKNRIFMDIDTIELGIDFVDRIRDAVNACDVMIVVIGKKWLDTTDKDGSNRLENPNDFVRLEIVSAIERGILIVPALVGGANMPTDEDLPNALKPLARRNGMKIDHTEFHADSGRLIKSLEDVVGKPTTARTEKKIKTENLFLRGRKVGALMLFICTGLILFYLSIKAYPYDDFNDKSFDGSYNSAKWDDQLSNTSQVEQQNGMLTIRKDAETFGGALYARQFADANITEPTFFEAKVKLDPIAFQKNNHIIFGINFSLSADIFYRANCAINGLDPSALCGVDTSYSAKNIYETGNSPTNLQEWHIFRIVVAPSTFEFSFYLDGNLIDSYMPMPDKAELLKKAAYRPFIEIYGEPGESVVAYIDYVNIGTFSMWQNALMSK